MRRDTRVWWPIWRQPPQHTATPTPGGGVTARSGDVGVLSVTDHRLAGASGRRETGWVFLKRMGLQSSAARLARFLGDCGDGSLISNARRDAAAPCSRMLSPAFSSEASSEGVGGGREAQDPGLLERGNFSRCLPRCGRALVC